MPRMCFARRFQFVRTVIWIGVCAGPLLAVNFNAPRQWPVGPQPEAVVVGDFNRDGRQDVAVVGLESDLSILLNNGDGTFQTTTTPVGAGTGSVALVAADFNGDGKFDLAIAQLDANAAVILLGNGDGTFRPGSTVSVPAITGLVVGDFNGDGKPDLAVVGIAVIVFLGNGDGTFRAGSPVVNGGQGPRSVTAGDFNGDGKLDLAVANYTSNNVSVMLGNGDGTFRRPVSYAANSHPDYLAAADFNGDGKVDLVIANSSSQNVSVLLGNGDGSFQPQIVSAVGLAPFSLVVADLNGDGKPDLVVCSLNIAVLLGKGNGTFAPPATYLGGNGLPAVAVGDLNGDGRPDLAVGVNVAQESGYFTVLNGIGQGRFAQPVTYPLQKTPSGIATADFDGDGKPDLAAVNSGSHNISILKGAGNGTFKPGISVPVPGIPSWLAVGDFNRDGKPDLAVTVVDDLQHSAGVWIYLGNGDGTFQPYTHFLAGEEPEFVVVADFNGDGKQDLAVMDHALLTVSLFRGNGDGTFQPPVSQSLGWFPNSEAVGDFNGDGIPDLVVSAGANTIYILLGERDGGLQAPVGIRTGVINTFAAVGDFNGDGLSDLAVVSQTCDGCGDGTVSILLGNGDGTFQLPVTYDAGGGYPVSIAVGDFNGDGKPDLVVANSNVYLENDAAVLLGNGDGTFLPPVAFVVGNDPTSMVIGDFNLDGKLDVAVTDKGGATVLTNTTP